MAPRRNGRALAVATAPVRCAVYTRKSTDEGLDKDFNTLDAQRELAEAYITSQRHEGWTAVPDRYDDGGYTGANTNRPALNRLLSDVAAGKIDCVVVYRYDRVSRNLLDFLQLMEFLKKHDVAFVSVSERFDTSTPHGEMDGTTYTIILKDERLVAQHRRHEDMALAPTKTDEFSGDTWFFRDIQFVRDDNNQITGCRVSSGRVRNLHFDKMIKNERLATQKDGT